MAPIRLLYEHQLEKLVTNIKVTNDTAETIIKLLEDHKDHLTNDTKHHKL